ncbi:MAG: hypothetical protein WA913_03690 [Pricia sp.]
MGILANDENQFSFIYSSTTTNGKKILGYVDGLEKPVRKIDISNQGLGHAVWVDIADKVGVSLGKLFSTEGSDSPDVGDADDFDTDDWLKLVEHNPDLLQNPIGIQGDRAEILTDRSAILEFYDVDSAGLKKTFHTEPPVTESQTENEKFVPPSNKDGAKPNK